MKQTPAARLKRLANRYAEAAIADSWKGGGDPAGYDAVEERLRKAHQALFDAIDELLPKEPMKISS